jgi:hypothetical protein
VANRENTAHEIGMTRELSVRDKLHKIRPKVCSEFTCVFAHIAKVAKSFGRISVANAATTFERHLQIHWPKLGRISLHIMQLRRRFSGVDDHFDNPIRKKGVLPGQHALILYSQVVRRTTSCTLVGSSSDGLGSRHRSMNQHDRNCHNPTRSNQSGSKADTDCSTMER